MTTEQSRLRSLPESRIESYGSGFWDSRLVHKRDRSHKTEPMKVIQISSDLPLSLYLAELGGQIHNACNLKFKFSQQRWGLPGQAVSNSGLMGMSDEVGRLMLSDLSEGSLSASSIRDINKSVLQTYLTSIPIPRRPQDIN